MIIYNTLRINRMVMHRIVARTALHCLLQSIATTIVLNSSDSRI